MSEPPEIVYQLLREAWKRGAVIGGVQRIYRVAATGRWVLEMDYGTTLLCSPEERGKKGWEIIKFPPPRKPISVEPLEVDK